MWVVADPATSPGVHDLTIHAVFIGFALSMVLGHAPIILPAVLGRALPYRAIMWVPLVLLQVSLVLRIFVGDLRTVTWAWQSGGALNVATVLLFLLVAVSSVVIGARGGAKGGPPAPTSETQSAPLLPIVNNNPLTQGES